MLHMAIGRRVRTDRGRLRGCEVGEEGWVLVGFVGRPRGIGAHRMLKGIVFCSNCEYQ